jgi:signal transduction histidine kinase
MFVSDPADTPLGQQRWLKRLAIVTAFNGVITVVMHLVGTSCDPFWRHAIYSFAIGTFIWLFIEAGLRVVDRPGQPIPWPYVATATVIGVVLGLVVGTSVADLINGRMPLQFWRRKPEFAGGLLVMSLCAGFLGTLYFLSQTRIAQLREQAEAARRQATQAQLSLLQSQLEPHMLFNTLANLKALIATDPKRADAMLDRLIAYLRATLSASRATTRQHTLGDEFARLRDYLALMQIRMGPRLNVSLDLPDELAAASVPPMLLQPLVENAIKHGLEPKVSGGDLQVAAKREGEELWLQVRDNGVGLPEQAADGYGTQHVRERLATLFGGQARFERTAAAGGGTLATLCLPLHQSSGVAA